MSATATADLVSIIVPIYNAGIQLVDALVSAQEQTHRNIEVICVNDGSTDDSAAIMHFFAEDDPRFRIIDKQNTGYGAAMNDGLAAAKGTWVAILEPDDWMDPTMLEEMLAYAATFTPAPDIIKCPYWWVNEDDEFGDERLNCTYKDLVHPKAQPCGLEQMPEIYAHHPSIWSALYRKQYLDEKGIRFPEYPGSGWADNRFLAETLLQTDRIVYLDKPFYNYRGTSRADEDAFARKAPLLPFERWQEMCDVMDELNITDERIWRAHIRHGMIYLGGVVDNVDLSYPGLEDAVRAMCERMDERIVLSDPSTPPHLRLLYAQMRNIECVKPNRLAYTAHMAWKGAHRVRINGPRATLKDVKRFFS